MPIRVDPRIDFAFKKLLGSPENEDLLIDFLNSLLPLDPPITSVELLNPFNDREYEEDKLSVVDLKARDAGGGRFQIEIQLQVHPALEPRMVYTLARVHTEQLTQGDDFRRLKPTISIWLLDDVLLQQAPAHHHRFRLHDVEQGVGFGDQLELHLLELPKWLARAGAPLTPEERWLYFFKSASSWDELPPQLGDATMRKAMGVLKDISQRERDLARYNRRLDQILLQRTLEAEAAEAAQAREEIAQMKLEAAERQAQTEALQAESEALQSELEQSRSALREAQAEIARLKAQRG
ncbi:MAG: Rpn family recombination-promoting nuclease/putative transposase [Alphaproteobacteria bacterium]|nr:Rpn family recombination-promoting nuclease/putative transposase [Alphaproteobacteria bacterium]MCB9795993.1 Rpn family recombination-promoting nuclease/putative transposase [Alphaproteobacteria bacterium]